MIFVDSAPSHAVLPIDISASAHLIAQVPSGANLSDVAAAGRAPLMLLRPAPSPNSEVPIDGDFGSYDNYSDTYGYYDADGGVDYTMTNAVRDGPVTASVIPATTPIPGSIYTGTDTVTFVSFQPTKDGTSSNQLVNLNLASAIENAVHNVQSNYGVYSIDISSTTNGHTNEIAPQDHLNAKAGDINEVNGFKVETPLGTVYGQALKESAMLDPNVRYVEGPGGNYARGYVGGPWSTSKPVEGDNTHVHIAVF